MFRKVLHLQNTTTGLFYRKEDFAVINFVCLIQNVSPVERAQKTDVWLERKETTEGFCCRRALSFERGS
jgi:hypothetical protein